MMLTGNTILITGGGSGIGKPQMSRTVRIHEFGGPEVLRIEDVEAEQPAADEVRIRVRAIGMIWLFS